MGRIKINDLTRNNKIRVCDMLERHTYRITYTTGDSYDVLVCCFGSEASYEWTYDKDREVLVVNLDNGVIGLIHNDVIEEIEEINIEANITN